MIGVLNKLEVSQRSVNFGCHKIQNRIDKCRLYNLHLFFTIFLELPSYIKHKTSMEVNFMDYEEAYNRLIENDIATEDEISLVTEINGKKLDTLIDILEVRTGSKDFNDI